jgi:hypothetical protein
VNRILIGSALIVALSACGGSNSGLAPAGSQATAPVSKKAHAQLRITFRIPHKQHHRHNGHYVSPSTQSIEVAAQSATGSASTAFVNVAPSSAQCTGAPLQSLNCTLSFSIAPGAYSLNFSAYDAAQSGTGLPASGNLLSTNTVATTIVAGKNNTFSVTLDGVPASVSVQPAVGQVGNIDGSETGGLNLAAGSTGKVLVSALDADQNTIIGPGAPALTVSVGAGASGGIAVTSPAPSANPSLFSVKSTLMGSGMLTVAAAPGSGTTFTQKIPVASIAVSSALTNNAYNPGYQDTPLGQVPSGAQFSGIVGMTYDTDDQILFMADGGNESSPNCVIRTSTQGAGSISVGTLAVGTQGTCDAAGNDMNLPYGVAYGGSHTLYVADAGNCTIDRITGINGGSPVLTRIAGNTTTVPTCDGAAGDLNTPYDVNYDSTDNVLFVADQENCTIRKITSPSSSPVMTTIAGTAGNCTYAPGLLNQPQAIAYDGAGTLYVADTQNCMIRKISNAASGSPVMTTLAGSTQCGFSDGTGTSAQFSQPSGVSYDQTDSLLVVTDQSNCAIRTITPAGVVSTIAGAGPGNCNYQPNVGNMSTLDLFSGPQTSLYVASLGGLIVSDVNCCNGSIGGTALRFVQF